MGNRLLEETGITFVADKSREFISQVREATSAVGQFTSAAQEIGKASTPHDVGFAIGTTIAAGASAAVGALAALAGAFTAVAGATAYATSRALDYAEAVDRIQAVTSLNADYAQKLYAGAAIAGVGVNVVTDAFGWLANRMDAAKQSSDDAFGSMGSGADSAAKALRRLNEDHARTLEDTFRGLAEQQASMAAQLENQNADYYRTLGRMEEDYARDTIRSREEMQTQLADMAQAHADRMADMAKTLAESEADYLQVNADAERDLNEQISEMRRRGDEDVASIQRKGNEEQERLAQDLATTLAQIDEKYAQKRESLMERIADPSTNPILRAFYRSQLNSLGGQQSAEAAAARAKYTAQQAALKANTDFEIAEVRRKLEEQEALERLKAEREAQNRQRDYARKLADLQAALAKENAEYDKQLQRTLAANARREEDARRSHDRQLEDLNRAHAEQLAAAQEQSAKLQVETARRIEDERRQYDRQLEDMAASAGGAAARMTPLQVAMQSLGIDFAAFSKMKPEQQFDALRDAIERLGVNAFPVLSDIFGPSRADEIMDFYDAMKLADEVGAPFTQQDILDMQETQRQFNLIKLQADLLWAKIGRDLMPIVKELLAQFKEWWTQHGPEVDAMLRTFFSDTVPKVVQAIKDISKWVGQAVSDVSKWVDQAGRDIKQVSDDLTAWFNEAGRKVDFVLLVMKTGIEEVGRWLDKAGQDVGRVIDWVNEINRAIKGFFEGLAQSMFDNSIMGRIWNMVGGINGIKDALQHVTDDFQRFIDSFRNVQLPWWLTPGSPTPMEWGIRGITSALAKLDAQMPVLNVAANVQEGTRYNAPASAQAIYQGARSTTNTQTTTVNMPVTFSGGVASGSEKRIVDTLAAQLARAGVMVTR